MLFDIKKEKFGEHYLITLYFLENSEFRTEKYKFKPKLIYEYAETPFGGEVVESPYGKMIKIEVPAGKEKEFKEMIKKFAKCYNHDIDFTLEFLIENDLEFYTPTPKFEDLNIVSFDIEVFDNKIGMISLYDGKSGIVISTKNIGNSIVVSSERELLITFLEELKSRNPHIIVGYNIDNYDIPILEEKFKKYGLHFFERRIYGVQIIDCYKIAQFFEKVGVLKLAKYDLNSVYFAICGKEKVKLNKSNLKKYFEEKEEILYEYNLVDSIACYEILEKVFDLFVHLSKLTYTPLYYSTRRSPSYFIERKLMEKALRYNIGIPGHPKKEEMIKRMTYEGAFVLEPSPGIYENIAVLDFTSMYPTIMIEYNIDYYTINTKCPHKKVKVLNYEFCQECFGLIPSVLKELFEERIKIKKQLKEHPELDAKQKSLKIIMNSAYGYLGWPEARWYSRECAESVTYLGRTFLKKVIEMCENKGFRVIYADTDSVFILYKNKNDVYELLEYINSKLPGLLNLELENFYVRGLFAKKRKEEKGAKKKYILLGEDGKFKIKGFEIVRRDWCDLAKETQMRVLEILLKEGSIEKAKKYVHEVIEKLKNREIDWKKLILRERLNKPIEEYEIVSPLLIAAKRGNYKVGDIVEYIIREGVGSISERAVPISQFDGKYDVEYYIEKQIKPVIEDLIDLTFEQKTLF